MRHTNRFLNTILSLGIVGALTLGTVSEAGESKHAAPSRAAKVHRSTDLTMKRGALRTGKHEIRETVEFTFQKIEAHFNPKEFRSEGNRTETAISGVATRRFRSGSALTIEHSHMVPGPDASESDQPFGEGARLALASLRGPYIPVRDALIAAARLTGAN